MGAVKEAYYKQFESLFDNQVVQMNGDRVCMSDMVADFLLATSWQDDEYLRSMETSLFEEYNIDTADFITDWFFRITAAIGIYTGAVTDEDRNIGLWLDMLAYTYHYAPRSVGRALQRFGLNQLTCQAIVYLIAGRLLSAHRELGVMRFEYLGSCRDNS